MPAKPTPSRKGAVTHENFKSIKRVLNETNQDVKKTAAALGYSISTVTFVKEARNFRIFDERRKVRSAKITEYKKSKMNTVESVETKTGTQASLIPTPGESQEPPKQEKPNITKSVIEAVFRLSVVIERHTLAIKENTAALKDLRERVAKSNQMTAYKIHKEKEGKSNVKNKKRANARTKNKVLGNEDHGQNDNSVESVQPTNN